jgi:hypothetical protein
MVMNFVRFDTKYGAMYYTADSLDKIFDKVLKERIEDGYWYFDEEEVQAKNSLESGKSFNFLLWRQDCEYEGFEVIIPENVL